MPIPGIIASQITGHLTLPTAFESISTYTVTGSAVANVTISSIPSTYKHLQLRILARETSATVGGQSQMRINGDSGTSYTYHTTFGNGSSVTSDGNGSYQWAYGVDRHTNGNDPASTFGANVLDFLDYANTSKYKTLRSFGGYDANGTGSIRLHSALWMSTSAITSLYFENQGAGYYAVGTQFALYGIKG